MGWTERRQILTSYEDIVKYLEDENCFHDYRIGNAQYDGRDADVTIERVISEQNRRQYRFYLGFSF